MRREIKVPGFDVKLWFSFEEPYSDVERFLLRLGVNTKQAHEYVAYGDKNRVSARTTYFPDNDLILVKMNYFDNNIRSISILMHEIVHAATRIAEQYEIRKDRELAEKEEAIAYIAEYIFEELMILLRPTIDYRSKRRDLDWFIEITHKLKTF
jgi:virulence-associated protein VapD